MGHMVTRKVAPGLINYTDNFERADAGDGSIDGSTLWFAQSSLFVISSGVLSAQSGQLDIGLFSGLSSTTRQKVSMTMDKSSANTDIAGGLFRCDFGTGVLAAWSVFSGYWSLLDMGALTELPDLTVTSGSVTFTWAAGDVITIQVIGGVYTFFKNGTQQLVLTDNDDTNPDHEAAPYTGVVLYNAATGGGIRDWTGYDLYLGDGGPVDDGVNWDSAPRGTQITSGITYSQSSTYSGSGSVAAAASGNMRDGSASAATNNGTATNSDATAFVKVDLGSSKAISDVVIGYDYLTNLGADDWGPSYTGSRTLQGSLDNSAWTTIATTPAYSAAQTDGVDDGLATVPVNSTWRYLRLYVASAFLAVTEFQVWEPAALPTTINYVLGTGGAAPAAGANNGNAGTHTTVTYNGTTLDAGGGAGGLRDTTTASSGGTNLGGTGDGASVGGTGGAATGDVGGGGGGGLQANGGSPTGLSGAGGTGGATANISGLSTAVTGASDTITGAGAGHSSTNSGTGTNAGSAATGLGCGGGGGGWWGGNGGAGRLGGGGGGAASESTNNSGGAGGGGCVVIQATVAGSPVYYVRTSGTSVTLAGVPTTVKIWAIGAGGSGGSVATTNGSAAGGGAGACVYKSW